MRLDGPITEVITQDKSERWRDARLGRFTASTFSDIVCAKGVPTQTMISRCAAVAAERLTGIEAYSAQTKSMEWGQDMEEHAFEALSNEWTPLEAATFVPFGDNAGCTPDAYATINGKLTTVDIKCPFNSGVFVQWVGIGNSAEDLHKFNKDYYWQIMAQARMCDTEQCALVYFDPRMPEGRRWNARVYTLTPEVVEAIDKALLDAESKCAEMVNELAA